MHNANSRGAALSCRQIRHARKPTTTKCEKAVRVPCVVACGGPALLPCADPLRFSMGQMISA
jgi:hypothetical protein